MNKKLIQSLTILIIMIITMQTPSIFLSAEASSQTIPLNGSVYVLDEDSDYDIDASVPSNNNNYNLRIGSLSINGNINRSYETNGTPSYEITDGELFSLTFNYISSLKNSGKDDWHLVDDGDDVVNGSELDDDIDLGALLFQTSFDGKKWVDCKSYVDVSKDVKFGNEQINDIQLSNGCYYRVIAAFKVERRTKVNSWYRPDDYDRKKIAQVYTFYASYKTTINNSIEGKRTYFPAGGKMSKYTVRTNSNNYSGSETIDTEDPHCGWDLGKFCLSGYTDTGDTEDIFLKKVGNKVKLTFMIDQDINKLNGNSDLFIERDKDGSDEEFKVLKHDMKHGELIVRHTDSENNIKEVKYSDFLAALAYPGVDISIQLFEEGNYEIHLDYAITNTDGWDTTTYYKTSFSFKIRNADCNFFVFDPSTGSELSNGDVTENGFYIDTAMSSYPKLQVSKKILNNTETGLIEDTRFNSAVSDGEIFSDEGIYTITAHNRFNDKLKPVEKTIYVGNNIMLTAYTKSLNKSEHYSIEQLKQKIDEGYTIKDDGTLEPPIIEVNTSDSQINESEPESSSLADSDTESVVEASAETSLNETDNNSVVSDNSVEESEKKFDFPIVPVAAGAGGVLLIVLIGAVFRKTKGGKKNE